MKKIGADILIECLKEQGVTTVFGYPGGTVLDIYDALYRDGTIEHVITSHEQGAAHAADGWARVTGKTGVVIATSGPGALRAMSGRISLAAIPFRRSTSSASPFPSQSITISSKT